MNEENNIKIKKKISLSKIDILVIIGAVMLLILWIVPATIKFINTKYFYTIPDNYITVYTEEEGALRSAYYIYEDKVIVETYKGLSLDNFYTSETIIVEYTGINIDKTDTSNYKELIKDATSRTVAHRKD